MLLFEMEGLKEIKKDVALMTIPVVMLTTSDSEKDIQEAYQHHCNCFITKSADYQEFINVVYAIKNFWIDIVKQHNKKNYEQRN